MPRNIFSNCRQFAKDLGCKYGYIVGAKYFGCGCEGLLAILKMPSLW
jgi:hypothetical protein